MIKLICENPHSHSFDKIGIVLRRFSNASIFLVLSFQLGSHEIHSLYLFHLVATQLQFSNFILTKCQLRVKTFMPVCFLSSTCADAAKSAFLVSVSLLSIESFNVL
jgi:hypothetical protein